MLCRFHREWDGQTDGGDVGKSLSSWKAPDRMMGGKGRTRKSVKG